MHLGISDRYLEYSGCTLGLQTGTWNTQGGLWNIITPLRMGNHLEYLHLEIFVKKNGGQLEKTLFLGHVSARQTLGIGCHVFAGTF